MDMSISLPTWITAIATALLAVLGALTAWAAIRTLKQARADSLARTRPYLFAHLVPGVVSDSSWDLIIKNAGQSTASDLHVDIDPWPQDDDRITTPIREMTQTRLTLPPGISQRVLWKVISADQHWEDGTSKSMGMGDETTVTVTYKLAADGNARREDLSFVDEYVVRTTGIGLTPVPSTGSKPNGDYKLKHIHQQLGLIAQNIRMTNY